MKKLTILSFLAAASLCTSTSAATLEEIKPGFAKNVIFLIPDGTNSSIATLARWAYNDGKPLNIDPLASGVVKTHNADTAIADSAPAGTAMATGWKTQDKLIGVKPAKTGLQGSRSVPKGEELAPTASVLEAAKLSGKATGIVVSSEIQHATPAAFSAHVTHRNNYSDIGEQQVFQDMNVVFGGGLDYLKAGNSKETNSKVRNDNQDMIEELKVKNYQVVYDLKGLKNADGDKVWGIFAPADMSYELDKDKSKDPTLAQMTEKALEILSKDKDGFFLMVEGSKVDWASHGNNPVAQVSEFKAFDKAVGVALDYAKKNKNTLVIVASDHGTGGLTIGNGATSGNYPEIPVENFASLLKKANGTEPKVAKMILKNRNFTAAAAKENLGITLSQEELKKIKETEQPMAIEEILGKAVAKASNLGYTTKGHTGEDLTLYVYSPDPANLLTGTVQNSDLALYAATAMNLNLDDATKKLFVPGSSLKGMGLELKADTSSSFNPEFIITNPKDKSKKEYKFFKNRNYYLVDGTKQSFNGVVVYNDKEVFFPEAALNKILGKK